LWGEDIFKKKKKKKKGKGGKETEKGKMRKEAGLKWGKRMVRTMVIMKLVGIVLDYQCTFSNHNQAFTFTSSLIIKEH